ncbi:MAG: right-handed parallel beta-helix repeat-containing protein, partial [Microgenomates group bacterium]
AGANPISPTAFTQVTIAQSTSAALVGNTGTDTNLVYLVESLRNMHPGWGSTYFWDPVAGNDALDGTSPSTAVLTFATAHTLTTAGHGDVIFCRPTSTSGTTIITETLNITKNNLKIRGPGISVKLIPTSTTDPTVNIAAEHVEFSGFYLETAATGSQNAINVNGDNVLIRDCWIGRSQGDGISVTSSARLRLLTDVIENCTSSGINFTNITTQSLASKCIINDNQNGISLSGTGLSDNIIENSLIYKNSNYGVTIGAGVARTTIRGGNTITNNTSANTLDLGTDTYIETPAGGASTSDIADAVWNELIDDHATSGTTGRTLRDAKKKATLASIK